MMQILLLLFLVLMPRAAVAADARLAELAAVPSRSSSDILGGIVGCDNAQKILIVTCRPYSLVGDGSTDDTAALQAAIDAAPDFSTIFIPSAIAIRVTETIKISNRRGLRIIGGGSNGQSGSSGSRIIYDGKVDNPIIKISGSRDSEFSYFTVDGNNKANAGIQAVMAGVGQATTFNRFHGMGFYAGSRPRANWIGLDICSRESTANCEKFVVTQSWFSAGGGGTNTRGIVVGHTNALIETIQDSLISGHSIGVQNLNGSVTVFNNLFDRNDIDVASVAPDPIIIQFNRTEGAKQFFKALGPSQVLIVGNRFGHPNDVPGAWIDMSAGGSGDTLTFVSNVFSGAPFRQVTPFAGGAGQLFSTGNVYDPRQVRNGQIPSMDTFHSGYTSFSDSGIRNILSTGQTRSLSGRNPVYLLHLEDYFGVLHSTGTKYKFFGSDASANLFFGDTAKPLTLDGSAVNVTSLKTRGSAGNKKVVCVDTATGRLYASSTGTDCSD
jgi:hypothetical protein